MKKVISKELVQILIVGVLIVTGVALCFQVIQAKKEFRKAAMDNFGQIESIIESNDTKLEMIKEEFADNCIIRARAAAYIAQQSPENITNIEECRKVASMLQVDELHFFNPEGEIYAGTNPEYYGYNVYSGEQIGFFQQMLGDYSKELCQDITPNTAEEKLMQYAAVWTTDHKNIVQVGLKPERVLKAMEGNDISNIFYMFSANTTADFYAVDIKSRKVAGSTRKEWMGLTVEETQNSRLETLKDDEVLFGDIVIDGKHYYNAAKKSGDLWLIMMEPLEKLYGSIPMNTLVFILCTMLLLLAVVIAVFLFLDKNIITSILRVNGDLKKIEQGKWDMVLCEDSLPEFEQLSGYINSMVGSILDFPQKLSKALEYSEVPIALCEYVPKVNSLTTTSRTKDILLLTEEGMDSFMEKPEKFMKWLSELFCEENRYEGNVYCLDKEKKHFVKKETFSYKDSELLILIDVTAEIREKERLAEERDRDALTGLYNRRAFRYYVTPMVAENVHGGHGAFVMIDLDNLKKVNDIYGHISGDRYICTMADILAEAPTEGQIAARLGGDEFVLVLYDMEKEEIAATLNRLCSYRGKTEVEMENGDRVALEFSIGVARYPEEETDYNRLISIADERMYEEKQQRKKKNGAKEDG